jgi:hypothetical protein
VRDVLDSKGIYELGGSTAGLGDVGVFLNGQINSVYFDKMVLGLKATFPTSKKPSPHKLWAPELGNGGFTEFTAYGSVLFTYQKYLNPHVMMQFSLNLPAHVDRRIPKRIVQPAGDLNDSGDVVKLTDKMVFGDRVAYASAQHPGFIARNAPDNTYREIASFDDYDTTVKGFADTISAVRITKGSEVKLRIGNMFERFILVRGFLDLFYDFRGKAKDTPSGVNTDEYKVDILREP